MMRSLEQLVCRIMDGEGKVRGTGFFIRPDGYVITCYHVVDACKGEIRVGIFGESEPITSEVKIEDEHYDIAVLKIKRENCQVLPLSTEWKLGDRIFSHGFSIQHSRGTFPKGFPMQESVLSGTGTVRNKKTESELEVLVLDNTEVDFGLSGAPALNASTGKVIGILRWKYQEGKKALVTPVEPLFEKLPGLKEHHELNQYPIIEVEDQRTQEIFKIRIQSVLEKGKKQKGEFFRVVPKWIDFEKGFVVERKEVDEIIKKLESKKVQLVLGGPASGKSVILKNIGFKLAKKGYRVYIIELKDESEDQLKLYFKEAQGINDEGTLIIVDDAHLKLSMCGELIRDFTSKNLRTKLIIGTREVKGLKGSRKKESKFEELDQTKIRAIDASETMIRRFLKEEHGLSDEHRIEAVSKSLNKYKDDLWYLSWALKTYDKHTDSVREEEIYSAINEDISETEGEDIFLLLSCFYRFEIPIEKRFLTKTFEIKKGCINDLICISRILEFKKREIKLLSQHHSSVASLIFKTYQSTNFPELGADIKERITEQSKHEDWVRGLFYLYLKSEPINALDVLIGLADNNGGETLFEELIEDTEIEKSIKKGIEKEEDIDVIGLFVGNIAGVSKEIALKLIDSFSSKIDEEKDIWKIESCVRSISDVNKEIAQKVANHMDIDTLTSKLTKEEVIWKIGSYVNHIFYVSEEVAKKIAKRIDVDKFVSRVDKEEDIERAASLVSTFARLNEEIALESFDSFSSKIDKEKDMQKIERCVANIADGSGKVALKLVNGISDKENIRWLRRFAFRPQYRAGSSHVAKNRKEYQNSEHRLMMLRDIAEEDVVRLLAHRAPGEEYKSIHPPLEEMMEPECSVREMVEPTEGAKAGDRIRFVQFVDTMQFAPITPRERALVAYNRYRGVDCCVSSASMFMEARERDIEKISKELIDSVLYDTARTSLRGRTVSGHSLRLDQRGLMFDPMMRCYMDEATGDVIYWADMFGGAMDKKVVLGKPLPEDELREGTTMYRNAAGGVWQEKDDPESMDVIAEIHWKRTVGGFQPWKKMSEIKGGKKDIGVKNLKLFVPRGGVE